MPEDIEMLDFEAFKERYEKVPVEEYSNNVREAVPDPVVSVHLLTYNHADYIEEAIESVLMQEVDFPMEIVLGDDDSSDGTREICIEYAKQYPDLIRLQLHHRENNIHLHGGPTHLFQYWYNTLSAGGKYIAILSGDDYWRDPLKLQKQCDFLEQNNGYVLSFHKARILESNPSKFKPIKPLRSDMSRGALMRGAHLPASTLFGVNVFNAIPGLLVKCLNEDNVTISLLGQYGKGSFQGEVGPARYRIHEKSIWSSRSKERKINTSMNTLCRLSNYYKSRNEAISNHFDKLKVFKNEALFCVHIENNNIRKAIQEFTKSVYRHTAKGRIKNATAFILRTLSNSRSK